MRSGRREKDGMFVCLYAMQRLTASNLEAYTEQASSTDTNAVHVAKYNISVLVQSSPDKMVVVIHDLVHRLLLENSKNGI